jgi:hypothetical protein
MREAQITFSLSSAGLFQPTGFTSFQNNFRQGVSGVDDLPTQINHRKKL